MRIQVVIPSSKAKRFLFSLAPQYAFMHMFIFFSFSLLFLRNNLGLNTVIPTSLGALSFLGLNLSAHCLNNIHDLREDRINKSERPVASGDISIATSYVFLLSLLIPSLFLSLILGSTFFVLSVLFFSLHVIYAAPPIRLKRYLLSTPAFGPLGMFAIPFLASFSLFGKSRFPFFFFTLMCLFTLFLSLTKDIEDLKGDEAAQIVTFPVYFGADRSVRIILIAPGIILICGILLVLGGIVHTSYLYPLLISAIVHIIFVGLFQRFYRQLRQSSQRYISQSPLMNLTMAFYVIVTYIFAGVHLVHPLAEF